MPFDYAKTWRKRAEGQASHPPKNQVIRDKVAPLPTPAAPPAPAAPAAPYDRVSPYLTPEQTLAYNAALQSYNTQTNDITQQLSQGQANYTYNIDTSKKAEVQDLANSMEAMISRGLFQSSIKDGDLADISATAASRRSYYKAAWDSLNSWAVKQSSNLNDSWAGDQGSFYTMAEQNAYNVESQRPPPAAAPTPTPPAPAPPQIQPPAQRQMQTPPTVKSSEPQQGNQYPGALLQEHTSAEAHVDPQQAAAQAYGKKQKSTKPKSTTLIGMG